MFYGIIRISALRLSVLQERPASSSGVMSVYLVFRPTVLHPIFFASDCAKRTSDAGIANVNVRSVVDEAFIVFYAFMVGSINSLWQIFL